MSSKGKRFLGSRKVTDPAVMMEPSKLPSPVRRLWSNNENNMWLSEKHVCDWDGVQCDSNGRLIVVGLQLDELKMQGTIPKEMQLLTDLAAMDFSENELQIPNDVDFLPPSIGTSPKNN